MHTTKIFNALSRENYRLRNCDSFVVIKIKICQHWLNFNHVHLKLVSLCLFWTFNVIQINSRKTVENASRSRRLNLKIVAFDSNVKLKKKLVKKTRIASKRSNNNLANDWTNEKWIAFSWSSSSPPLRHSQCVVCVSTYRIYSHRINGVLVAHNTWERQTIRKLKRRKIQNADTQ